MFQKQIENDIQNVQEYGHSPSLQLIKAAVFVSRTTVVHHDYGPSGFFVSIFSKKGDKHFLFCLYHGENLIDGTFFNYIQIVGI